MNVSITSDGCLVVTGTTGTEIYALTQWYEAWTSGKATFQVRGEEVRPQGSEESPRQEKVVGQ